MGLGMIAVGILLPSWFYHPLDPGFRLDCGIAILGLPFIVLGLLLLVLAGNFYSMKKWTYRWVETLFLFGPGGDLLRMAFDFEGLIHQEDVRKAFDQPSSKHE
jgi:ABC-type molybdate transport system permease subunit